MILCSQSTLDVNRAQCDRCNERFTRAQFSSDPPPCSPHQMSACSHKFLETAPGHQPFHDACLHLQSVHSKPLKEKSQATPHVRGDTYSDAYSRFCRNASCFQHRFHREDPNWDGNEHLVWALQPPTQLRSTKCNPKPVMAGSTTSLPSSTPSSTRFPVLLTASVSGSANQHCHLHSRGVAAVLTLESRHSTSTNLTSPLPPRSALRSSACLYICPRHDSTAHNRNSKLRARLSPVPSFCSFLPVIRNPLPVPRLTCADQSAPVICPGISITTRTPVFPSVFPEYSSPPCAPKRRPRAPCTASPVFLPRSYPHLDILPGRDGHGIVPLSSAIPRKYAAIRASADDIAASPSSLLHYMRDLRPRLSHLDAPARARVLAALEVASVAHEGQVRKSGEPFIIHPIAVAAILADMGMDRDSIIAGLLHDTVEDTQVTLEQVEELFGRDVRKIVEGETKFSKLATKVYGQAAAAVSTPPSSSFQELKNVSGSNGAAGATHQMPNTHTINLGEFREAGPNSQTLDGSPLDATSSSNSQISSPSSIPHSARPPFASGNGASNAANTVHHLVSQRERDQAKREAERDKQADNLRAMFLAMTEDVRVIIVKLADRLHNMRTLEHMPPIKQKAKAKETLEFFAPLAHRLGMRRIKSELEEISFRYLHPTEYRNLRNEVEALKRRTRFAHHLSAAQSTIEEILRNDAILHNMIRSVQVEGTTKELYSIFRRTLNGETLSSMLDLATLRVVVDLDSSIDSNQACYHVLGRIHSLWTPLPKRLKDYIAFPKPNGYQSLHTTVRMDQSRSFFPLEIQIRTAAMNRIAEEGIAAELFQSDPDAVSSSLSSSSHQLTGSLSKSSVKGWRSDATSESSPISDFAINADPSSPPSIERSVGASVTRSDDEWRRRTKGWLISIREYIEEFSSSRDLVDAVRRDLLGNRVFVFTPKGRILDLPNESTPVDLAYAIHSDVGNAMIGAKINGRMVGLDYRLQNADVVKIITSHNSPGPSQEWMSYAKSRTARQKIRQFLRARERESKMERGRAKLAEAARRRMEPEPNDDALVDAMPRLHAILSTVPGLRHIRSVDDLLIAVSRGVVGSGNLSLEETVLTVLRGRRQSLVEKGENKPVSSNGVVVKLSEEEAVLETDVSMAESDQSDASEQGRGSHDMANEEATYVDLGQCCNPVRGDSVVGFRLENDPSVVVVHRSTCSHAVQLLRDHHSKSRLVAVRWMDDGPIWEDGQYSNNFPLSRLLLEDWSARGSSAAKKGNSRAHCQPAHIEITAHDCDGLLSYVTGIVAGLGKSIRRAYTETDPSSLIATLAFEVLVEDTKELRRIVDRLNECEEVMRVRRFEPNEGQVLFPSLCNARSTDSRDQSINSGQAKFIEIISPNEETEDVGEDYVMLGDAETVYLRDDTRDEDQD